MAQRSRNCKRFLVSKNTDSHYFLNFIYMKKLPLLLQKELVKRLHLLLTVKDSAANIPKNLEARRRLEFFTNSLFMDMPPAKPVCEMMPFRYKDSSFTKVKLRQCSSLNLFFFVWGGDLVVDNSVFTPYYSETVLYSSSELRVENEDGISTLFYLQKIFPGMFFVCNML